MSESEKLKSFSVNKLFNAPVSTVFSFFTDPKLLALWHTPVPSIAPAISVDLKVGGSYRFVMTDTEGSVHVAIGVYKEIIAQQKLVFSWQWENGPHPETTVTVLFRDLGGKTEVTLNHEGFVDQDVLGHHNRGWQALLGNLALVLP